MSEATFKSSLSMEEIEENFKNIYFFDGIMAGPNEALAYEKEQQKHSHTNGKKN